MIRTDGCHFDFAAVGPGATVEKCPTNESYSVSDFGTMCLCCGRKE
jgi:hypothetical protein